ncbi:MAG: hypothetical protein ACI4C1_01330 [Lachnospiraceae bacterium]
MKQRKWMSVVMIVGVLIGTVGCSAQHTAGNHEKESVEENKETTVEEIVTILPLSEEQKAQSHITGYLAENIIVDADLTSSDKYADGLNSYYISYHQEFKDVESYMEHPTFFGQEFEQVLAKLDIDFDENKMTINNDEVRSSIKGAIPAITKVSEEEKKLVFTLGYRENKEVIGIELLFFYDDIGAFDDRNNGAEINAQNPLYNRENLEFADGAELGEQIRELLEDMTGYEVSDSYACIPVTTENRLFSGETVEEDYYTYIYHWGVDGFPWRMLQLSMGGYGNAELAEDVIVSESELWPRDSWNIMVLCFKDGITYFEIEKYFCVGDLYQDNHEIYDVNLILEDAKKYLENRLVGNQVFTVYDIELCYASYFSDAADGPIQNIVMPFWVIRYMNGEWGIDLVYNGFTGKMCGLLQAD